MLAPSMDRNSTDMYIVAHVDFMGTVANLAVATISRRQKAKISRSTKVGYQLFWLLLHIQTSQIL